MQIDITNSNTKPFNVLSLHYNYTDDEKLNIPGYQQYKPETPFHKILIQTIIDYNKNSTLQLELKGLINRINLKTINTLKIITNLNSLNEKRESFADFIMNYHIDEIVEIQILKSLDYTLSKLYQTNILFREKLRSYQPIDINMLKGFNKIYYKNLNDLKSNYKPLNTYDNTIYNNILETLEIYVRNLSDIEPLLHDISKLIVVSNNLGSNKTNIITNRGSSIEEFIKINLIDIIKQKKFNLSETLENKTKDILLEWFVEGTISKEYKKIGSKIEPLDYDISIVKQEIIKKSKQDDFRNRLYKLYKQGKLNLVSRGMYIKRLEDIHRFYKKYNYEYKYIVPKVVLTQIKPMDKDYFDRIEKSVLELCFNSIFNQLHVIKVLNKVNKESVSKFFNRLKYEINSIDDKSLELFYKVRYVFKEELTYIYKDMFNINLFNHVKELVTTNFKNIKLEKSIEYYKKHSLEFYLRLKQTGNYKIVDNSNSFLLYEEDKENSYCRILEHFRKINRKMDIKSRNYRSLLDLNYLFNKNEMFKNWVLVQSSKMIQIYNSTFELFGGDIKQSHSFITSHIYDDKEGNIKNMSRNIHSIFVPVDIYDLDVKIQVEEKMKKVFYTLLWRLICIKFAILMTCLDEKIVSTFKNQSEYCEYIVKLFGKIHAEVEGKEYNVSTAKLIIKDKIKRILREVEDGKIDSYINSVISKDKKENINLFLNL